MVKLQDLLAGLDYTIVAGDIAKEAICGGVVFDSRRVQDGSLFVAIAGRHVDGHTYLETARAAGAAAALVEKAQDAYPTGLCVVQVENTRIAAAHIAARYWGSPSADMDVVAVTGTNGKTSVAAMLEAILRWAGRHTGVIGTGGPQLEERPIPILTTTTTTPEAPDLQAILRYMADRGADSVVMEASSTALLQHRTDSCAIDVGIFTNLSPDHLEDHGTMQAYQDAKMRLFKGLCRRAVANADDPVGAVVQGLMPAATITFSAAGRAADFSASNVAVDVDGTSFTLDHADREYRFHIPIPGHFAVANALAAVAAATELGLAVEETIPPLAALPQIPGRFETFRTHQGAAAIVDYAHSQDSLDQILRTIRGFAPGQVITVFGCGGNRDTTKRAPMGRTAGELSDLVIITNDNARNEDPDTILDQIQAGLVPTGTAFERIADRRSAIAHALSAARSGDVVLVAGKGAETTQLIAGEHHPFSDIAVIRELDADGRRR